MALTIVQKSQLPPNTASWYNIKIVVGDSLQLHFYFEGSNMKYDEDDNELESTAIDWILAVLGVLLVIILYTWI